ncbi:tetratricopeptide repeat protein [Rhodoplanes sp. TEM]|uniref:Tetratricopeptide repeat protein n=1 Tax=Rhodoplanes tepidamans TaxID=200616 RepID=A0ABT5JEX6_RHOTP|nr:MULTISPECIES: tetratricopeptide repeat protein [Rhodoplanes]MDC7788092.1 tetratricopeptide repeat protein [Rhodoplanes tepidamans]MDC7987545.1 tetratricopeptide repeat protein [Rhodoplanes sp. TEM]MDQ0355618.1 hypothetical protein [Rhodoplanes tepidamans]
MTDIFQEVDEEVRRERLQQFWKRYGGLVIALCVLVVAGVAGWRGWQWYEARQAAEASIAFDAAVRLAQEGKHGEASAAFAKLAVDVKIPAYRSLARLREADEQAATDRKAAIATFDAVAGDAGTSPLFREVATLRAGLLMVDTAPYAELQARLEPLARPDGAFRHSAREMLALSAWKAGDAAAARRWAEAAAGDADAPAGLKARVDILLALLGESAKS